MLLVGNGVLPLTKLHRDRLATPSALKAVWQALLTDGADARKFGVD